MGKIKIQGKIKNDLLRTISIRLQWVLLVC